LQEDEFQPDVVGAKACNLAKLRERLPEWILVPRSVALPFGTFEAVLADPVNAAVAQQLAAIDSQLAGIAGSKTKGDAAAAAAVNGGSNGAAAGVAGGAVSAVALLARARELVEKQLKPPADMQQVREKPGTPCFPLEALNPSDHIQLLWGHSILDAMRWLLVTATLGMLMNSAAGILECTLLCCRSIGDKSCTVNTALTNCCC
jgi:hypothetical protein